MSVRSVNIRCRYQKKSPYISCIRSYSNRNVYHRTIITIMSIVADRYHHHHHIIVIDQWNVITEMVCSVFMKLKIIHRHAGICPPHLHRQIIEMVQIIQVIMAAMIS